MRHGAGRGKYVYGRVREDAGVVRGEYYGQLEDQIYPARESRFCPCPFIEQSRFPALDEV